MDPVVRRGSRGRALDHRGSKVHAGDVERVRSAQLECQLAGPAAHVEGTRAGRQVARHIPSDGAREATEQRTDRSGRTARRRP